MTLDEQNQLIRAALDKLGDTQDEPQDPLGRSLRVSLSYALADHEEEGGCDSADGDCFAVDTARKVLSGELR